MRFNRAIDPTKLNLYDGGGAGLGLPDVVLTGPNGAVRGSLLLDADHQGFHFVKTGHASRTATTAYALESGGCCVP